MDHALKTLTLTQNNGTVTSTTVTPSAREQSALDIMYKHSRENSKNVASIVQAMRKLREAIVATSRTDEFAQGVYVFIIRATILMGHMESYHPALLHLLRQIHCNTPLPESVLHEMLGYHVLDLACRMPDTKNEAYRVRSASGFDNPRIDRVLKAIANGNWIAFWEARKSMSVYEQCLLEDASKKMRMYIIQCLSKTYLTIPKEYAEHAIQKSWTALKTENAVNWALEGDTIIIKERKRK